MKWNGKCLPTPFIRLALILCTQKMHLVGMQPSDDKEYEEDGIKSAVALNASIKITSPQSIVLRLASDVQPVWMEYSHPFFILGRHSSDRAWPKEKKEVEKSCWNWFGEPETGSSLAYKSRVFRRRSIWRKNLFKTRSQNYLMLLRPEDALMNYRQYSKGSYFGIIQSSLILE